MSTPAFASLIWAAVYGGLGAFFLIVGRRFERPGYSLLGVGMSLLSGSAVGFWMLRSGESESGFLGARLMMLAAALAPAFNTHFLFHYSGHAHEKRVPLIGYSLAGAAVLADMVAAYQLAGDLGPDLQGLTPAEFLSPVPVLSWFVAGLFALHLILDVALLMAALRQGKRQVLVPLLVLILLGPIAAFGLANVLVFGSNLMITQMLNWVYGLAIVWGLLTELRGAEGLLQQTATHLEQRTAELQVSYAEIELMHDELTRKQQLAAVGELAASIAHEVRNPLAIIMNASTGLRRATLSAEDRETLLSIVDEEAERLNHLVSELLRFARPMEASRAPVSLLDICQKISSATEEGYEVRVSTPPEESLEAVWVDPALFRLALDNLMANATQAMPGGGIITIKVQESVFSDGTPAAAVSVRDTGAGMTPEELDKARKPFFTTKPRGSGLGLPIVERVVDAHGGEINIDSEQGVGTTVTLKVPFEQQVELGRAPSSSPGRVSVADAPAPPGSKVPSTRGPGSRRSFRSVPPGPSSSRATAPDGVRISSRPSRPGVTKSGD